MSDCQFSKHSTTVKDLGEKGLLALLQPFFSDRVGDDAALMGATLPGCEMVVTTDVLVENVHFSALTTKAEDVGWRAAAANLSDLAAMGATPWGITIAIGLPPTTPIDWLQGVYQGLTNCLKRYGTEIVGGDTVRSPIVTLSITAFGQVPSHRAIQRHTAQVNDAILISGWHGLSKTGLELLLNPDLQNQALSLLSQSEIEALYQAHQRPQPRLDVPPLIWEIYQNFPHLHPRITGMDSSDGLADAIEQICVASQVGAAIDWEAIPIANSIKAIAGDKALDWVLYGGEDFELVLCLPQPIAEVLQNKLPRSAIIGRLTSDQQISGLDRKYAFQHFGQ